MGLVDEFILKIKRQESPFYGALYRMIKGVWYFRLPVFRPLALGLYYARKCLITVFRYGRKTFYYEPMFRARCTRVGANLAFEQLPFMEGQGEILIGDSVSFSGKVDLFVGNNRFFRNATLTIGNHVRINHGTLIVAARSVSIGNHCRIAGSCFIFDNDSHPLEAAARRSMPAGPEQMKPVVIEDDVWIGYRAIIGKGVTIGRGSVVAAGAVVTKSVPPYTVVGGNPARVLRTLLSSGERE